MLERLVAGLQQLGAVYLTMEEAAGEWRGRGQKGMEDVRGISSMEKKT